MTDSTDGLGNLPDSCDPEDAHDGATAPTSGWLGSADWPFEGMMADVGDLVYTLDATGHLTGVNGALLDATGYAREEVLGEHVSSIIDDSDVAAGDALIETLLADSDRDHATFELDLLARDGTRIRCEDHVTLLSTDDGEFRGTIGVLRDLTDRRIREEALEALHEASRSMMTATTRQDVCSIAARASKRVLGYPITVVRLLADDGRTLVPTAMTAETRDRVGERAAYSIHDTPAGRVFKAGDSRVYDDIHDTDDDYEKGNARAAMYTPLGDHGVISIADTKANVFDRADVSLANVLAANTEAALDRVERENDLRRERDRFATLFNAVPDPAVHAAIEEGTPVVRQSNAAFGAVFAYGSEPIVGEPLGDIVTATDRGTDDGTNDREETSDGNGALETIERVVASGESAVRELRCETVDGPRDFLFRTVAITGDDGERGIYGVYTDITDRVAHQRRVTELHDATRRMMSAGTPEAVCEICVDAAGSTLGLRLCGAWLYDENDRVLRPAASSPASTALFGSLPTYTAGEGISWQAFETGETYVSGDLSTESDRYNDDTPIRSEIVVPLGDYGVLNVGSLQVGAFDTADEHVAKLLAANAEAALGRADREAQVRRREAELRRQNERLEEFASVVSHDIRNPLNVILGNLELARQTGNLDHLDPIGRAADRVNRLTTDLLTLARHGGTVDAVEKLHLASLVANAWTVVGCESARLTVDERLCAASTAWGNIEGDPVRAGQLLENLLANAIEHGGSGVGIEVGPLSDAEGFYVADDGPGIPPTKRERVFDHDYTTSPNGIGLGLAIVETVADTHGWRVAVTESERGGARFEIRTG